MQVALSDVKYLSAPGCEKYIAGSTLCRRAVDRGVCPKNNGQEIPECDFIPASSDFRG